MTPKPAPTLFDRLVIIANENKLPDDMLTDAIAEIESLRRFKAEALTLLEVAADIMENFSCSATEYREFLAKHKAAR